MSSVPPDRPARDPAPASSEAWDNLRLAGGAVVVDLLRDFGLPLDTPWVRIHTKVPIPPATKQDEVVVEARRALPPTSAPYLVQTFPLRLSARELAPWVGYRFDLAGVQVATNGAGPCWELTLPESGEDGSVRWEPTGSESSAGRPQAALYAELWLQRAYVGGGPPLFADPPLFAELRWRPGLSAPQGFIGDLTHRYNAADLRDAQRGMKLLQYLTRVGLVGRKPLEEDQTHPWRKFVEDAERIKRAKPRMQWAHIALDLGVSPEQLKEWRRRRRAERHGLKP
jgi:hypothetical protein